MLYKIEYAGFCIQGLIRKNNEDNLWCNDHCLPIIHTDEERDLNGSVYAGRDAGFAVFDGMGGEERGEAASYVAALEFGKRIGTGDSEQELCRAMNRKVLNYADTHRIRNMGTTVVGLKFNRDKIQGFNLGDSRCYLYTDRKLKLLTEDHTITSLWSGREMLTQCLGMSEKEFTLEPYVFTEDYRVGDIFLLCSDGVSRILQDKRLLEILSTRKTCHEKMVVLKEVVLKKGAPDNATALLFEIQRRNTIRMLTEKINSVFQGLL